MAQIDSENQNPKWRPATLQELKTIGAWVEAVSDERVARECFEGRPNAVMGAFKKWLSDATASAALRVQTIEDPVISGNNQSRLNKLLRRHDPPAQLCTRSGDDSHGLPVYHQFLTVFQPASTVTGPFVLSQRREAIQHVVHFSLNGSGMCFVTGPAQSGKSFVLDQSRGVLLQEKGLKVLPLPWMPSGTSESIAAWADRRVREQGKRKLGLADRAHKYDVVMLDVHGRLSPRNVHWIECLCKQTPGLRFIVACENSHRSESSKVICLEPIPYHSEPAPSNQEIEESEAWGLVKSLLGPSRAIELMEPVHVSALDEVLRVATASPACLMWLASELKTRDPRSIASDITRNSELHGSPVDHLWQLRSKSIARRLQPAALHAIPFLPTPFDSSTFCRLSGLLESDAERAITDLRESGALRSDRGLHWLAPRLQEICLQKVSAQKAEQLADQLIRDILASGTEISDALALPLDRAVARTRIPMSEWLSPLADSLLSSRRRGTLSNRHAFELSRSISSRNDWKNEQVGAATISQLAAVAAIYMGSHDAAEYWIRQLERSAGDNLNAQSNVPNLRAVALLELPEGFTEATVEKALKLYDAMLQLRTEHFSDRDEQDGERRIAIYTARMNQAQMFESLGELDRAIEILEPDAEVPLSYLVAQRAIMAVKLYLRQDDWSSAKEQLSVLAERLKTEPALLTDEICFPALIALAWVVAFESGWRPPKDRMSHRPDFELLQCSECATLIKVRDALLETRASATDPIERVDRNAVAKAIAASENGELYATGVLNPSDLFFSIAARYLPPETSS